MRASREHLPQRKHLTRLREVFRLPVGEVYLLTLCTAAKRPVLMDGRCARTTAEALEAVATRNGYAVLLYCVMPDHVHAIVAAHADNATLSDLVRKLKTWCTRSLRSMGVDGAVWQKEFFDHRIRSRSSLTEKCRYVAENPVRAGLVRRADDWVHTGGLWWRDYVARSAARGETSS